MEEGRREESHTLLVGLFAGRRCSQYYLLKKLNNSLYWCISDPWVQNYFLVCSLGRTQVLSWLQGPGQKSKKKEG